MIKVGDKTRCLTCMKPIIAQMAHNQILWVHDGVAQPRHIGEPEAYTPEDIDKCRLLIKNGYSAPIRYPIENATNIFIKQSIIRAEYNEQDYPTSNL